MKIFLKGLNTCQMRKGKLSQYRSFFEANQHELVPSPGESDLIFIWTCSFRTDVRDNSILEILNYQTKYKAQIVVGGCLPGMGFDLQRQGFRGKFIHWKEDEIEMQALFGSRASLGSFLPTFSEKNLCDNADEFRKKNPKIDVTFHDQFIKLLISEGCTHACTFCAEKMIFPVFKSFPPEQLEETCLKLVRETGATRVVLLADNLGDYGSDIGSSLPQLMNRIRKSNPSIRFVLNNLNPADFVRSQAFFFKLISEGAIYHLNLPIQSVSDRLLRLMGRQYRRLDVQNIFKGLKDLKFWDYDTHIIVGFPTETEEDFDETISFLVDHSPRYVLASVFMGVVGTPAEKMHGKISPVVVRDRMRHLQKIMDAQQIICNAENSLLMSERFKRINKDHV